MTAPYMSESERIDFTVLTDQLRILPTSRSWSGVQESIRTLQSRPSDWRQPDMQDHAQNVEVFAETIREHADLIAYSFACAAALGQLAPAPLRPMSTYRALQTLSSAYNFRALSAQDVHLRLKMAWTKLRRYERGEDPEHDKKSPSDQSAASHEPLPDGGSPKVATKGDVEPFFTWLEKMIAELRASPGMKAPLARVQSDAWESVRGRYEDAVRDVTERIPAMAEVMCRLAEVFPSRVLGFSIRETPALAWADFIVPGSIPLADATGSMPWWVHGLAAHALGFRSTDMSATRDLFSFLSNAWPVPGSVKGGEAPGEWDAFFRSAHYLTSKRSHPQSLFIIRRTTETLLARWSPCPTVATLPLTTPQAENLARLADASLSKTLATGLLRSGEECVIAVEYPLDSPNHAMAASALLKVLTTARGSESRIRRLSFGPLDQKPTLPFGGFYLEYVPQRYEDLVARPPS